VKATLVDRVEAVALGQEPFERLGVRPEACSGRAVTGREAPARIGDTLTGVEDALASLLDGGPRQVVRQLVRPTCALDGQPARRVEAEEPDPGPVVDRHIGADVELGEGRKA